MLFLHIGRHKCGSTTIQKLLLDRQALLAGHAIHAPSFGRRKPLAAPLPAALTRGVAPADEDWAELLHAFRLAQSQSVVVSSEFLFLLPAAGIAHLARALAGVPVRLIVYVRSYESWLVSLYVQALKKGHETRGFRRFADDPGQSVSALPGLGRWAAVFGWQALSVRALDRADLEGGNLLTDFAGQIGLGGCPAVDDANRSPPWWMLEVGRALYGRARTAGAPADLGDARRLMWDAAAWSERAGIAPAHASYMAPAQAAELRAQYERDVASLSSELERPIRISPAAPLAEGPEPSLALLTAAEKRALHDARPPAASARIGQWLEDILLRDRFG